MYDIFYAENNINGFKKSLKKSLMKFNYLILYCLISVLNLNRNDLVYVINTSPK